MRGTCVVCWYLVKARQVLSLESEILTMYKLRDGCWQVSYFFTCLFGLCLVNQSLEIVKASSCGKVIVSQLEW